MKSLTVLKKELTRLRAEYESADLSYRGDSNVVKTKKAYDKALDKARKKADEKAGPIAVKLHEVREQIKTAEEAKRSSVPSHIAKLFVNFRVGTDYGPVEFKVLWVSPRSRFFIMTWPGHTFWASIMEPQKYASSEHFLMDCEKVEGLQEHGSEVFHEAQVFACEGRLLKAKKEEWKKHALEQEKS